MFKEFLPGHLLSKMRKTIGPLVQIWLVNLENISGEDHLGSLSRTCYNSLDFMRSQVLGLVNDKERLAETASPDIGQRSDKQFLVLQ